MESTIIPLIHTYQQYVAEVIALFRSNRGVRGHLLRAWRRSRFQLTLPTPTMALQSLNAAHSIPDAT